jgi:hypothetical protein
MSLPVFQTQNGRILLSFVSPQEVSSLGFPFARRSRLAGLSPIGPIGHIGPISPSVAAIPQMVGVTGLEPVTLRLSSACSNQLSYTPVGWLRIRRRRNVELLPALSTPAQSPLLPPLFLPLNSLLSGGMGIRTPDL